MNTKFGMQMVVYHSGNGVELDEVRREYNEWSEGATQKERLKSDKESLKGLSRRITYCVCVKQFEGESFASGQCWDRNALHDIEWVSEVVRW